MRLAPFVAWVGLTTWAVLVAGCGSPEPPAPSPPERGGPPAPRELSIPEFRTGDVADDEAVTFRGVVVTEVVDTVVNTSLVVQEPEGGPNSAVFVPVRVDELIYELPQVGAVVDVENVFRNALGTSVAWCTQDETACRVTQVGDGAVPEPEVLVPSEIAADLSELDKWVNVLSVFQNVRVAGRPIYVSNVDYWVWSEAYAPVTGPARLEMTNLLPTSHDRLPSRVDFPTCYASAVGLIGPSLVTYDPSELHLRARTEADLQAGGTDCPPVEHTAAECDDEIDNDLSGFIDCADRGCDAPEGNETLCDRPTTVIQIRDGTFDAASGRAVVSDVIVTAVQSNGSGEPLLDTWSPPGFWIQDPVASGPHNGLFVLADPGAVAIGDTMELRGRVETITMATLDEEVRRELAGVTMSQRVPGEGVVDAAVRTIAQVRGVGFGEENRKFAGVLVRIEDVSVSAVTEHGFTIADGADSLPVHDRLYPALSTGVQTNDCVSVTGVMSDRAEALLPRGDADIAPSGGC